MLEAENDLEPMEFLRQLSFENANLTEPFTKFYEQAPHSSGSESSDDEFMPTQSTVSTQSTLSTSHTLSQTSYIENGSHMDYQNESAEFLFEDSNENQPTIDISMHVDDTPAEYSFVNSNENQPTVNASIHPTQQRPIVSPFVLHPTTVDVPANIVIPEGCVLRPFSIMTTSVKDAMDKLKKDKQEKENAEHERRQQLLAQLALNNLPDEQPHHCKICRIGATCNMTLIPCGHACCTECWETHLIQHRKKCEDADLSPEDRIKKINEPGCLFCRTKVKDSVPLFFS